MVLFYIWAQELQLSWQLKCKNNDELATLFSTYHFGTLNKFHTIQELWLQHRIGKGR